LQRRPVDKEIIMTTQDLDRIRFVTRHFNDLQGLRCLAPFGLIQLASGLAGGLAGFPRLLPMLWLPYVLMSGLALFLMVRTPSYYRSFGQVERKPVLPSASWAPLSVFSPAGAAPPIEPQGQPVPLRLRRLLIPIGLTLALLLSLRAIGSRVTLLTDSSAQDPWLRFNPPVVLIHQPSPVELVDPSLLLMTEILYALSGSLLLSLWLWRESRLSQGYLLALALPLLGLPALGLLLGLGASIPPSLSGFPLLALAYMWMAQLLCGSALLLAGLLDHLQLVRTLGRPVTPQMEEPS
jgi:hypothetical protein